ncbi:hypothetical protein AAY473_005296 [Plecturocebus cupreus]
MSEASASSATPPPAHADGMSGGYQSMCMSVSLTAWAQVTRTSEMGFHHVAQVGQELQSSGNLPALASQCWDDRPEPPPLAYSAFFCCYYCVHMESCPDIHAGMPWCDLGLLQPLPPEFKWSFTLLPRLECSGANLAHCNFCPQGSHSAAQARVQWYDRLTASLNLLGSRDLPISTFRVPGTTDMCHHTLLIFVFFVEIGFCNVAQAGLKLLGSKTGFTMLSRLVFNSWPQVICSSQPPEVQGLQADGFHYVVALAGLRFLGLSDPLTSASQRAGITGYVVDINTRLRDPKAGGDTNGDRQAGEVAGEPAAWFCRAS